MHIRLACLLIVGAFACAEAVADQITLKNGDRLSGKIVDSDGGSVRLKSDLLGELTVPLAAVETISADAPLYVTLADGRTVSGVLNLSGGQAEIRAANAAAPLAVSRADIRVVRAAEAQREYERSLNPGWLENWSGGGDLGLSLTSGNSDTTNFALGLGLTRATLRDKTSLYAASVYNRDSTDGVSRTVANTVRAGLRYDRDINRRWFGYGFTDFERNRLQDLNLRLVLGGGLGYHAVRGERTQLDILGGLAWNKEYFEGDFNDRSSAEAQVGQTLAHRFNSRLSLKEEFFFFPNLSEGGEYRINFDAGLTGDVTRRVGWHLTLSDRYLSNPPSGLEKNDLLLTTGLRVKFGPLK